MSNSLHQILNNGKTSLLAHQQALATTSNNAANISTESYHRRDVHFKSQRFENGVDVSIRRRAADQYLASEIYRQNAALGAADARSSTLSSIQQLFIEGEGSLGSSIDRFFQQIRSLSVAPTDPDRRQSMVTAAQEVTEIFNGISNQLEAERHGIDSAVENLTQQVNSIIERIAGINTQLSKSSGDNAEQGALLDLQEGLLRELSESVPVSTFRDPNGHLTVLLNHGEPLVQSGMHASIHLSDISGASAMRTLELVGISGATLDLDGAFDQGSIGGLLHLRDQTLQTVISRLDDLAFDFGSTFNTQHGAGYDMDANAGLVFFENIPTSAGSATTISVNTLIIDNPAKIAAATSAAEAVGGNDNLLELEKIQDLNIAASNNSTVEQEVANMVGEVGRIAKDNEQKGRRAKVSLETSKNLEQANIGISLDEEMIDLMQYQRAYQAGSKVVQTVNQMYDTVMQLK